MSQEVWLGRPQLADRWSMPVATLSQWAWQGYGPRFAKFGRHVRYRLSDVIAWENRQFASDREQDDDSAEEIIDAPA